VEHDTIDTYRIKQKQGGTNRMKFFSKLLLALILCFYLCIPMASAKSEKEDGHLLVALGDSITFGYNLDLTNAHPSSQAFPALIADDIHYQLRNFGIPGDTSTNLLAHLKTMKYRQALSHADVITLDIGSNDLLQGASSIVQNLITNPTYVPSAADIALLQNITANLAGNLGEIIAQIREATDAPIVLYTIYNPFYGADQKTALLLGGINGIIASYAIDPSIAVADAFSAFAGKQNTLVLPYDIHPTFQGQEVLEELGIAAIQKFSLQDGNKDHQDNKEREYQHNSDRKQAS
jgi:lysophospholipase L1-like esterase